MRFLPVRSGHLEALAYAPDGRRLLASAHPWGRVWAWDLGAEEGHLLRQTGRRRPPLAYSPTGHLLALGSERHIILRENGTGQERFFLNPGAHEAYHLAFTPDGRHLLTAGFDTKGEQAGPVVKLWDVTTGKARTVLGRFVAGQALAIASDARLVLWQETGSSWRSPTQLSIWHIPAELRLARVSLGSAPSAAAFSPTGKLLAVGVGDTILIYEVGRLVEHVERRIGRTPWAGLTLPFRRRMIAARMPHLTHPCELEGHTDTILALAFTPEGDMLLSGGRDRTVRLWDLTTRKQRALWQWPIGVVYSLAVAPDAFTAAAGGNAGRMLLWDLDWQ